MARDGLDNLLESRVFTSAESINDCIREIVFGKVKHVVSYP
jgi:hypothetical protein